MLHKEQNIYVNGLLHYHETKKASGHPKEEHPTLSVNGENIGRPPAEDSMFSFLYSLQNDKGINVCNAFWHAKRHFVMFMALDPRGYKFCDLSWDKVQINMGNTVTAQLLKISRN